MLLRPRRPPPLAPPGPPSPDSPDADLRPAGDGPGTPPVGPTTLGALAEPESPQSPVSPGSAQRTPWSARETELLLGTLLQPAVWRSLLLDRRQALPTYRRVSAALARQQVRRTPAQCRRRYKFLKDKLRDAQGQPPGPFDAQIRELMGLLGDNGRRRVRRRPSGPGRPQRGRRPAAAAPAHDDPGASPQPAARDPDVDAVCALRFSPSVPKSANSCCAPGSPPAPAQTALRTLSPERGHAPGSPPPPDPAPADPDEPPGSPENRAPPQAAPPSLNAALLQTLTHLGDIVAVLGPLRDQLLTLNQHVEQLRGSFDQTVSLAVGFILGSAAAERGVLRDPRE
ncbi:undifferentiated embryonic cell transcription factor 1 [Urocitellus parryii]|uniref:Myb/SANT-like DNA-binding domain-containing protein n=1 Tax=Urocitellus parryii TaxID=9999 RepID=A0A8D2I8P7_UROPR|nr:undifferentiated embryonic cell transcription factor 1 [Urocitellus parryii]